MRLDRQSCVYATALLVYATGYQGWVHFIGAFRRGTGHQGITALYEGTSINWNILLESSHMGNVISHSNRGS